MQVTLQLYFRNIFQSNPLKIVIKLTKLKRQNVKLKYLEDINQACCFSNQVTGFAQHKPLPKGIC